MTSRSYPPFSPLSPPFPPTGAVGPAGSLPLCPPKDAELVQKFPSLGEALQGDELTAHSNVKAGGPGPWGCVGRVAFPANVTIPDRASSPIMSQFGLPKA